MASDGNFGILSNDGTLTGNAAQAQVPNPLNITNWDNTKTFLYAYASPYFQTGTSTQSYFVRANSLPDETSGNWGTNSVSQIASNTLNLAVGWRYLEHNPLTANSLYTDFTDVYFDFINAADYNITTHTAENLDFGNTQFTSNNFGLASSTQHIWTVAQPTFSSLGTGLTPPTDKAVGFGIVYINDTFDASRTITVTSSVPANLTISQNVLDTTNQYAACHFIVEVFTASDFPTITIDLGVAGIVFAEVRWVRPELPTLTNHTLTGFTGTSFQSQVTTNYDSGVLYGLLFSQPVSLFEDSSYTFGDAKQFSDPVTNPPVTSTPIQNAAFVQQQSVNVTTRGTQTLTWTGLEAGRYYFPYLVHTAYGQESVILPNQDNVHRNSSGNIGQNDLPHVKHFANISGAGLTITFPLSTQCAAGDDVYMYIVHEDSTTKNLLDSDPDGITFVAFGSSIYNLRIDCWVINGWLANGNYDNYVLTFDPAVSTAYTAWWVVANKYDVTDDDARNIVSDFDDSEQIFDYFISNGIFKNIYFSTIYTQTGGTLVSRLKDFDSTMTNAMPHYWGAEVVGGTSSGLPLLRFESRKSNHQQRVFYSNDVTDGRYYQIRFPMEALVISNLTQADLQWDRVTYTWELNYAAAGYRIWLTDTVISPTNAQFTDLVSPPAEVLQDVISDHDPNSATQSVTFTGLEEKSTYYVYFFAQLYNRTVQTNDTLVTPDGPNEDVIATTEVLVTNTTAATVSKVNNPPTVSAVLPDVWQDGLGSIVINTTNITSHRYTRVFVEQIEQRVDEYQQNQLTITARQDVLADGTYTVSLTDYEPDGYPTWIDEPEFIRAPDPLAANVSLFVDGTQLDIGENIFGEMEVDEYYTTTTNGTILAARPYFRGIEVSDGPAEGSVLEAKVFEDPFGGLTSYRGMFQFSPHLRPDAAVTGARTSIESWTMEFFFKYDASAFVEGAQRTFGDQPMIVVERINNPYYGFRLVMRGATGAEDEFPYRVLQVKYRTQSSSSAFTDYDAPFGASEAIVRPDTWHHVAISRFHGSPARINVWLDGRLCIDFNEPTPLVLIRTENVASGSSSTVGNCALMGSPLSYETAELAPNCWHSFRITFDAERYPAGQDIFPRPAPRYL